MATAKIIPAPLARSLGAIAQEIHDDYVVRQGKPVYFAAKPYVEALAGLRNFDGHYYSDSAEEIVIKLLGNLSTWRGETATRVRNELKAALAHHQIVKGTKRPSDFEGGSRRVGR
jgi:hypothetical protein